MGTAANASSGSHARGRRGWARGSWGLLLHKRTSERADTAF